MLAGLTLNPDQEQLFTDPSPGSNTVFVNERVSFQTEDQQRIILVQGVVFSHYSLQDRAAEAYSLVKLFESGYADQNIRTTLPVASVTRLAPYGAFRNGSNPED